MNYYRIGQGKAEASSEIEAAYAKAALLPGGGFAEFQSRCATYGITVEKDGTHWDDKCMAYEYENKLGPFPSKRSLAGVFKPLMGIGIFAVSFAIFIKFLGGGDFR
jgi:hypothetical protein